MMKIVGSLVIIFATTLYGFELSNRLSRRTKQIRYLKVALESLETEIVFALTPLGEAFDKVSRQIPFPISDFFRDVSKKLYNEENSASNIFYSSLTNWYKKTDLEKGELNILRQFGQTLGQQDLENQRKQIRLAIQYFDQEEKLALEAQKKYESMYKSLGFLAGVFIVLIMI